MSELTIRLHAFVPRSAANGPHTRAVVWFQGCTLGCVGCFNPLTHPAGGDTVPVAALVSQIAALIPDIEGVTITGGEPLQQPAALAALLRELYTLNVGIIVLTGYSVRELLAMPDALPVFDLADVIVAGRYNAQQHRAAGLRGSSNKQTLVMTGRYTLDQIEATPPKEIIIGAGRIARTGVRP